MLVYSHGWSWEVAKNVAQGRRGVAILLHTCQVLWAGGEGMGRSASAAVILGNGIWGNIHCFSS